MAPERRSFLRWMALALALVALTALHELLAVEAPRASTATQTFPTAVLPETCALEIHVSLRDVLAQPAFVRSKERRMVGSSVLDRERANPSDLVERLRELTRSRTIDGLGALHVCKERLDGAFVASVQGDLRPHALLDLARRGGKSWQLSAIAGVDAAVTRQGRAFHAQAEDGSVLVASSADGLARAIERSRSGSAAPAMPGGFQVWARVTPDRELLHRLGRSILDWEHARTLELGADFRRRTFRAALQMESSETAVPMAEKLRALAAQVASTQAPGDETPNALVYLVRRARIRNESSAVVVDSELGEGALDWFAQALAESMRTGSHAS